MLTNKQTLVFPTGFLWGAATAAHQVEGNNRHSDWWGWEQRDLIPKSGLACNQYHLFKQDFEMARQLGQNAHRLSIEWARIEPEEGKWDEKALAHYREVLTALHQKKMRVMLTLYHFTLPDWFAKRGGFSKKENLSYFRRYVLMISQYLGNQVDYWLTINEPNVYVSLSYMQGMWPPKIKNPFLALRVYLNLARAHKIAYLAIKSQIPNAQIGAAINLIAFHVHQGSLLDRLIKPLAEPIVNHSFFLLTRKYWDFIGVNYYFFHNLKFSDIGLKLTKARMTKCITHQATDLGWPIYPKGIYEVLVTLKNYRLPIYITENGLADAQDKYRTDFIVNHLQWVHQAIREKIDIRGYFHWSLIDNYEWVMGFKPRFGLIAVDYNTQKRTIRPSARVFSRICHSNYLSL
jgi:beta-glucosidase